MLLRLLVYAVLVIGFFWSVLPTLRAYKADAHKRARYKFFFIWLLSSLPILISVALAPSKTLNWGYVLEMSGSPFSMSEQLVYTSAFLSPVLFVFIEAIKSLIEEKDEGRARRFRHVMRTYHRVLLPSLLLMVISVLIYSGIKTDATKFTTTEIYDLFGNKAIIIYLASLVYWYCVLVIESAQDEDYVSVADKQVRDFTAAARGRIRGEK